MAASDMEVMVTIQIPADALAALRHLVAKEHARRDEQRHRHEQREAAERDRREAQRLALLPAARRIALWAQAVADAIAADVPIEVFAYAVGETRHRVVLEPGGTLAWTHHYKNMGGRCVTNTPEEIADLGSAGAVVRALAAAIDDGTVWRHVEALARGEP